MDEETILNYLKDYEQGMLRQQLLDKLNIDIEKDTTKLNNFNDLIMKLENNNQIEKVPIKKIPKSLVSELYEKGKSKIDYSYKFERVIYYLPENKNKVFSHWRIKKDKPAAVTDLDNIYVCWIFVEKGVVEPRKIKGYLYPVLEKGEDEDIKDDYYQGVLPLSLWDAMLKYKGDSDFLVFLVDNKNDYPVQKIGANIQIETRIRTPMSDFHSENCTVKKKSFTYHFECENLLPDETAYIVVNLSREKKNFEVCSSDKKFEESFKPNSICNVKAWYNKNTLHVRGATVFKKQVLDGYNVLMEWNADGIEETVTS